MSSDIPYLLRYTDYGELIKQRDVVSQEMAALGTIVLTANMNVEVLMADMVSKKKRAIARIDASTGGQMFLTSLLETAPVEELPVIVNRLKTGGLVVELRDKINNDLTVFQKHLVLNQVPNKQFRVLVWKFLEKQKETLYARQQYLNDNSYTDEQTKFVITIIEEEIVLLQNVIRNTRLTHENSR